MRGARRLSFAGFPSAVFFFPFATKSPPSFRSADNTRTTPTTLCKSYGLRFEHPLHLGDQAVLFPQLITLKPKKGSEFFFFYILLHNQHLICIKIAAFL